MSTKKRPGDGQLRGMLLEGHFGQPRELRPADPAAPTHMHLEVQLIKPYEHNPRRQRNPMYGQIKTSILAKRGLDDPIGITRRPGEELYTVRAGGNTRLSILKELLDETRDPVFERAYCLFVPWTSESDCIAAHLIENDLRGELVFIDKALAIKGLMDQLHQEAGTALRRAGVLKKFMDMGYYVSKRQLIRYEYACELEPFIPEAFAEGLGGRKIDEIRDAEKKYRAYWNACGLGKNDFEPLFRATLAAHDSDGWSLELALEDLESKISETTGKPINMVRLELDAASSETISESPVGREGPQLQLIDPAKPSLDPTNPEQGVSTSPIATSLEDTGSIGNNFPLGAQDSEEEFKSEEESKEVGTGPELDGNDNRESIPGSASDKKPERPSRDLEDSEPVDAMASPDQQAVPDDTGSSFLSESLNEAEAKQPRGTDLKSLRCRAHVLATRFAQSFEHPDVVQPSANGYGFILEIPKHPILEMGDMARWSWWLLFSLSEQAVTKARLGLAPPSMRLPKLLIEDRLDEAFALTGDPPDAIQNLGHVFFSSPDLSEQAFRDLLLLIETCRILRNNFPENTLWPCPTIEQLNSKGEAK